MKKLWKNFIQCYYYDTLDSTCCFELGRADNEKENSNKRYFRYTHEYLFEARGRQRAISSNKYRNTCRKQGRGRSERGEEKREDNHQVIRI
jgi:hypothetical protein